MKKKKGSKKGKEIQGKAQLGVSGVTPNSDGFYSSRHCLSPKMRPVQPGSWTRGSRDINNHAVLSNLRNPMRICASGCKIPIQISSNPYQTFHKSPMRHR